MNELHQFSLLETRRRFFSRSATGLGSAALASLLGRDRLFASPAHALESLPETPIAYVAVKPSIARWKLADEIQAANALIAADCAEDDTLMFLDVWPPMLGADGKPKQELFLADGLHMSDAGYQIWVDMLRPQLDKLLAASGDAQE